MKLDLKDRIILMNVLPAQGTIKEIANVIECNKLLAITEAESKDYGYHNDGQQATWNPDIDTTKEIKLKHEHVSLLKKEIERLDSEEKVNRGQYETFVKIQKL